jgi:hypothetical protein
VPRTSRRLASHTLRVRVPCAAVHGPCDPLRRDFGAGGERPRKRPTRPRVSRRELAQPSSMTAHGPERARRARERHLPDLPR